MAVNLALYEEQKKNGTVTLIRNSAEIVAVVSKRYNPDNGEPAPDNIENVSLKEIESMVKALETDLARLKGLRDDLKAVK